MSRTLLETLAGFGLMMSASPGRGGGDGATYGVDRSTMANSQALTWQRYSYSLPHVIRFTT